MERRILSKVGALALGTTLLCNMLGMVEARRKVGHNQIEATQTKFNWWTNRAMPMIRFDQGCMSYAAVAPNGDYSGGLKPSGSPGGGCRTARFQQVYTRTKWFTAAERRRYPGARLAIMYAYFFPKDQGNRQGRLAARRYTLFGKTWGGHRYDWEEVVVFLDARGNALRAAVSSHNKYKKVRRSGGHAKYWSGNRIKVKYGIRTPGSLLNNGIYYTTRSSTDRPKEACWNFMTKQMRDSISQVSWGAASPKIVDGQFFNKIAAAW